MTRRSPRSSAVLAAVVMLALTGCGNDSDPIQGDTTSTAPTAPTPSPVTSSQTSASPTAAASPTSDYTAAPATGQLVQLTGLTLNAPADWPTAPDPAPDERSYTLTSATIEQALLLGSADLGPDYTLDERAASYLATSAYQTPQKRLPDVTIAGQLWFHFGGQTDDTKTADTFGTQTPSGNEVRITFENFLNVPAEQQAAVTGSVLASVSLS